MNLTEIDENTIKNAFSIILNLMLPFFISMILLFGQRVNVVLPHSYASVILSFFFFLLFMLFVAMKRECLCHFTDGCYSCLEGVAWLKTDIPCECILMLMFFIWLIYFSLFKLLLMDEVERDRVLCE